MMFLLVILNKLRQLFLYCTKIWLQNHVFFSGFYRQCNTRAEKYLNSNVALCFPMADTDEEAQVLY